MKKKILLGILFFLVVIPLIIYITEPEFIHSWRENMFWIKETETEPVKAVEKIIGIQPKAQVFDPDFIVEEFVVGLDRPTTMAFIGKDILVLEKNSGKVKLVRDGILQENPVLDVEVNNKGERGLLGITTVNSTVYLYFTVAEQDGGASKGNHIYKYIWNGQVLEDPVLIHVLPGHTSNHNGGAMTSDLDGNVYAVIGDQTNPSDSPEVYRILQNFPNGKADDTSVIIRVGFDDSDVKPSLSSKPFDYYYAIGIRNSFGLTIDPVTGNLWDTENGPENFDEINLVLPKFNSGWVLSMGPATNDQISRMLPLDGFTYSDPEFSWERPVAPTGLAFLNSDHFLKYKNHLLVGDCNLGNLYKFKLNTERTSFVFNDPNLADLVLNEIPTDDDSRNPESMNEILFGSNFGCITDLELGPDGFLYVVSITSGAIYRILPTK